MMEHLTEEKFQTNPNNDRGISHIEFKTPDHILVVDGLYDRHFVSEVEHWFMTKQNWMLDNTANRYTVPYGLEGFHKFLAITHFNFIDTYRSDFPGLDVAIGPLHQVYRGAINHLGVEDSVLSSVQSNAMPYKCDGTWHVDVGGTYNKLFNNIVAVDQLYTLMFFQNNIWEPEWGGSFFVIDSNKVEHEIKYVPGRLILFPAHLSHRANAPNEKYIYRLSTVFRLIMTINWVFENTPPVEDSVEVRFKNKKVIEKT